MTKDMNYLPGFRVIRTSCQFRPSCFSSEQFPKATLHVSVSPVTLYIYHLNSRSFPMSMLLLLAKLTLHFTLRSSASTTEIDFSNLLTRKGNEFDPECSSSASTAVTTLAKVIYSYLPSLNKFIHYDPLMMSQKESPRNHPWVLPKRVASLV